MFFQSRSQYKWAFSSTGNFMDNDSGDKYISELNNTSIPSLYTNARISPISLTYYGFCLKNGNYTVKLHFAEIMFTGDKTYSSLGRRIFDIYIQGQLVRKDFNIADEEGGDGKEVIRTFPANVTSSTLEIRFYWAGKGTTVIPSKGTYGPLISAISVSGPSEGKKISVGAVVGIVAVGLCIIFIVLGILWWKGCLGGKNSIDQDGTIIAVKQLSSKSKQGNREFVNEIGMISALQHPHLALVLKGEGRLMELVDPRLGYSFNEEEVMGMINVALMCTNTSPTIRPAMSAVVSMLEGRAVVQELVSDSSISSDDARFNAIKNHYQMGRDLSMNESQTQSMLRDGPWTGSSTSAHDLYPVNLDSRYLTNRE
ncbi:hypothetical protein HHK36_005197 [Tetracentron sinense]|uniref:non-specific serine/threonine protein kinase n=1 Tax=Tetracentron sinense TaxID=13715 RepID=A0A834ZKD8_TETSI|nr:hypothetical protein HHK36_005197 [Tetracentron sinense]